MKKVIIAVLVIFLLSFSAVFAQRSATDEDTVLSFLTVGDMFGWEDSGEYVYNVLLDFEPSGLKIEADYDEEYGKTISATAEVDGETVIYVFYFDDETELLWEIECITILSDNSNPADLMYALIDEYGLDKAKAYRDEYLEEYASGFDTGLLVAGSRTIALLAGSEATKENYGSVAFVLIDRDYYENGIK